MEICRCPIKLTHPPTTGHPSEDKVRSKGDLCRRNTALLSRSRGRLSCGRFTPSPDGRPAEFTAGPQRRYPHSLGLEEEVVDGVEVDVAGRGAARQEAGPLPATYTQPSHFHGHRLYQRCNNNTGFKHGTGPGSAAHKIH